MTPRTASPTALSNARSSHGEYSTRAYELLRDLIIRGRMPPGTRAVESDLASRLGLSRTPIRESLARLSREGFLVPSTSGRRIELSVAPLTPEDVVEFWGIIGALEGFAIEEVNRLSASDRATLAHDLEGLNEELAAATSVRPRDTDLVSELQTAFHLCFMDRCAGPRLRTLYDSVRPHVQRYEWAYATQVNAPYSPSRTEHRKIIAAVARGDGSAAREALLSHWENGARRTVQIIRNLDG